MFVVLVIINGYDILLIKLNAEIWVHGDTTVRQGKGHELLDSQT